MITASGKQRSGQQWVVVERGGMAGKSFPGRFEKQRCTEEGETGQNEFIKGIQGKRN